MVDLMEVRRAFLSIPGIDDVHISYCQGTLSGNVEVIGGTRMIPDTAALKRELTQRIAQYKIPKYVRSEKKTAE
jgi:hypothetical protein